MTVNQSDASPYNPPWLLSKACSKSVMGSVFGMWSWAAFRDTCCMSCTVGIVAQNCDSMRLNWRVYHKMMPTTWKCNGRLPLSVSKPEQNSQMGWAEAWSSTLAGPQECVRRDSMKMWSCDLGLFLCACLCVRARTSACLLVRVLKPGLAPSTYSVHTAFTAADLLHSVSEAVAPCSRHNLWAETTEMADLQSCMSPWK